MRTRGYYLILGVLALVLASVPYLYGYLKTPPGHVYYGLTSNIDDCMAYFSWMNEYAAGRFTQRNLFSTEQSPALLFYFWFWILGILGKGIGTVAAFHMGRVLGGIGLLWAACWLIHLTIASDRARKLAFALLCFSSGLGWVFGGFDPAKAGKLPIDTSSPEAITFLTLNYSPLFAPMTALMVVFIASFFYAQQTGRLKDLWPACVAGAILGNSHTYDVVPLFLAVGLTLLPIPSGVTEGHGGNIWQALIRLVIVGLATLPTTAYNLIISRIDPLFKARVWANEPTLTSAIWWVFLGLGLPFIFALVAIFRKDKSGFVNIAAWKLLACWLVAHLVAAYLPVPVQRKMLMGVHVPVCLLAGVGLSGLLDSLSKDMGKALGAVAVALSIPSNVLALLTDISRLDANAGTTAPRPYLTTGEKEGLDWLKLNATDGAVLVAPDPTGLKRYPFVFLPHLAPQVAGLAGRVVYNGHWSETLDYKTKIGKSLHFFLDEASDSERHALCSENGIRYVVYVNTLALNEIEGISTVRWSATEHPDWLEPVFSNTDLTIFRVSP
ncbi:MAG: hypothetical protein QM758_03205 [Armatimonas sp.]